MLGLGLVFWVSVYFVVWWTTLFVVLPLGIRSHHDEGTEPHPGADPGAPVNPNLVRKFITTTWLSAIILAVIFVVVEFGLVPLPEFPRG